MKSLSFYLTVVAAVQFGGLAHVHSQGLPTSQPKVLTLLREHVKVGHSGGHSKFEVGYPAAFEKAKSPDYYFAMASVTGPDEVWYVMSNDSYAAVGEGMKRQDKDPVLSAELNRLALAD